MPRDGFKGLTLGFNEVSDVNEEECELTDQLFSVVESSPALDKMMVIIRQGTPRLTSRIAALESLVKCRNWHLKLTNFVKIRQ